MDTHGRVWFVLGHPGCSQWFSVSCTKTTGKAHVVDWRTPFVDIGHPLALHPNQCTMWTSLSFKDLFFYFDTNRTHVFSHVRVGCKHHRSHQQ